MIKLIIFDWDDVFALGSKEAYQKCYHAALKGVGVNLDPEEEKRRILENWGKSHREELSGALRDHLDLVARASEIYEQNLFGDTFVSNLQIIPGSVNLLKRLSKKYLLALASGVHPKVLKEKTMPKFNIPDVFKEIITAYDIADPDKTKPHPYIAQQIMRTQGVYPQETVLVGDAESDVLMAKNAGIVPIVVLTGHLSRKGAEELGVVHIIEDVTQLESELQKLP